MQEYTVRVCESYTEWYQNGRHHRLDGPAIEWSDGGKSWYQNGERHRVDAPAIEYSNGDKYWYQNGNLHRLDGPAVKYADGSVQYWENGKQISNPNNAKEMTVAEIAKELGHNVKIVK